MTADEVKDCLRRMDGIWPRPPQATQAPGEWVLEWSLELARTHAAVAVAALEDVRGEAAWWPTFADWRAACRRHAHLAVPERPALPAGRVEPPADTDTALRYIAQARALLATTARPAPVPGLRTVAEGLGPEAVAIRAAVRARIAESADHPGDMAEEAS